MNWCCYCRRRRCNISKLPQINRFDSNPLRKFFFNQFEIIRAVHFFPQAHHIKKTTSFYLAREKKEERKIYWPINIEKQFLNCTLSGLWKNTIAAGLFFFYLYQSFSAKIGLLSAIFVQYKNLARRLCDCFLSSISVQSAIHFSTEITFNFQFYAEFHRILVEHRWIKNERNNLSQIKSVVYFSECSYETGLFLSLKCIVKCDNFNQPSTKPMPFSWPNYALSIFCCIQVIKVLLLCFFFIY